MGRFLRAGWLVFVVGVCFAARPAAAQTPSPLAEWQYSSGIQLQRLFEPTIPTWQVELGLGAQYAPVFDGIGKYQVQPGPVIDIRYKDDAFVSTGEGVGVNLFSFRHVRFGAAITYDLGRSPHLDGTALTGLGTIHPAPEIKIFAGYALAKAFPLVIRVDVSADAGEFSDFCVVRRADCYAGGFPLHERVFRGQPGAGGKYQVSAVQGLRRIQIRGVWSIVRLFCYGAYDHFGQRRVQPAAGECCEQPDYAEQV
jgi:hypothetical protein